jgi:hypothetical protein
VAAGAAIAAAAVVSAALAVTPPKGDVGAIGFFSDSATQYLKVPGVKIVERGYFFLHPNGGNSVSYSWGRPPQPGYVPATATVTARLAGGKIVAYLAQLHAPKVRRVRVLMAGGDVFVSSSKCWTKKTAAASPLGTGGSYLFNDGGARFLPAAKHGGSTTVTLTYTWVPGSTASETDTFSARKPPRVNVLIKVTGGLQMTIHKSITPLTKAPVLPVAAPPAVPRPKPLCP